MSISHLSIDGIDIYLGDYDDILPVGDVGVNAILTDEIAIGNFSPEQLYDIKSLKIDKRRRERALTYTLINYAATSNPKYHPLLGSTILHHPSGAPYLSIPSPKNPLNSLNSLNTINSLDSLNSLNSLPSLLSLSLSLSHCRTCACIALGCGSNRPIGIDIEDYSDKLTRVKSKFINEADETALNTLLSIPQSHLLLVAWTIKEAAYKAAAIDNLTLHTDITLREISPSSSTIPSTPFTPFTSTVTANNLHLHCTSLLSPSRCLTLATQQTPPNSR